MARRDLRPGSFRGVPFLVAFEAEDETGRRAEIHRYPQRDDAYVEDLGRKTEPFTIEAMVLGDDYLARANELHRACGDAGPGDLVHPWLGTRRVFCLTAKRKFSSREGGSARFSLTFVDAGDNRYPTSVADTRIGTRTAADSARIPIEGDFSGAWSVDRSSSFVGLSASDLVRKLSDALSGASMLPRLGFTGPSLPGYNLSLSSLSGNASSLISTPATLSSQIFSLIRSFGGLFASPRSAARGYQSLASWSSSLSPVPAIGTATRLRQADNQAALVALVSRAALVEEARQSADIEFEHYDEAVSWRRDLSDRLDTEMLVAADAGDDASYRALENVRVAAARDIGARGADLSRLATFVPATTRPSLAVAWQIYGDDPTVVEQRAADLARRNRVVHPGFVPGGRELQVLTDA